MRGLLLLSAMTYVSIKGDTIVSQDSSQCYFNKNALSANGFNQGSLGDSCYSQLGTISANKHTYIDGNGNYAFRLSYYGQTGGAGYVPTDIVIEWTQKQWITEASITDYDISGVPTQAYSDGREFKGLGLNSGNPDYSYIDGNAEHANWWNAVLTFQVYGTGIPAYNGATAIRYKLEILEPECGACEAIDAVTTRIDGVESDISAVESRIDALVAHLQSSSAQSFKGDAIGDGKEALTIVYSQTESLLLCVNALTIVIGLCICWRGGLFSKNNGHYAKVSVSPINDMESEPINS